MCGGGVDMLWLVDRIRVSHEAVRTSLQLRREPLPNDADLPRLSAILGQVSLARTVLRASTCCSHFHSLIRISYLHHPTCHWTFARVDPLIYDAK